MCACRWCGRSCANTFSPPPARAEHEMSECNQLQAGAQAPTRAYAQTRQPATQVYVPSCQVAFVCFCAASQSKNVFTLFRVRSDANTSAVADEAKHNRAVNHVSCIWCATAAGWRCLIGRSLESVQRTPTMHSVPCMHLARQRCLAPDCDCEP